MTLTPVEIRHVKPAKTFVGGYDRDAIDRLLDEIVASFEDVWRERADMADKVEQLESDLVRYREIEGLLRTTLVSAEKAAVTLKEQARKEAELIVEEARAWKRFRRASGCVSHRGRRAQRSSAATVRHGR